MKSKKSLYSTLFSLSLFLLLEALSFVFIAKESLFQGVRISSFAITIKEKVAKPFYDLKYWTKLGDVNRQLVEENIELKNRLEALNVKDESLPAEGGVERNFPAESDKHIGFSFISAKVISNSTNRQHNYIILNRGSRDGVTEEMGVITNRGVVGVVSKVSPNYCYVTSLLNIDQSISAKLDSSGAFGPLSWGGKSRGKVLLKEIPYHITFSKGDTVSTSGYSTIFPPDIPIGSVESSYSRSGIHHQIEVKLFEDFSSLRWVRLAINHSHRELKELTEKGDKLL